jgi:DNA-binding NarL/FixJ family response regulator
MNQRAAEKIESLSAPSQEIAAAPVQKPDPTLFIVGKNSFQNDLLKAFLEDHIALPCAVRITVQAEQVQKDLSCGPSLILYDCYGQAAADIWIKLGMNGALDPAVRPIALFNAIKTPEMDFEKQAIEKQLRGVFYIDEPPERLPKGIEKMLAGELWYSRKTTSAMLMESHRFRSQNVVAQVMLTPREKEILIAISSGASNSDIANEFFISLHTVKTHIYNIYKKIDVRNRLEATLWVARYL